MDKQLIWAYYIRISDHFWADEYTVRDRLYDQTAYKPENDVDFKVWDEVTDYLSENGFNMIYIDIGDGVKFESHPEIAAPNAVSKEFLKQKLDEARAKGLEPIPKLNFSSCHDTWLKEYRRMLGTSIYRKVCKELIDETCELFGKPRLFHLGLDEETDYYQRFNEISIIRHEKVLYEDYNVLFDACRRNGARPWIWGSYCEDTDAFVRNMPKDVLISHHQYKQFCKAPKDSNEYKTRMAFVELAKLGYDQLPLCSAYYNVYSTKDTVHFCRDNIPEDKLLGFCTASWHKTDEEYKFSLLEDASRLVYAKKELY